MLLVEDIVDTGLTLHYLRRTCWPAARPASRCARCWCKDGIQKVEPDLRYVGFRIPDEFVVGYGLDVAERYRNLAAIHSYVE